MDARSERKTKKVASDAGEQVQESSARATEVFRDYQLKMFSAAQENIIGMFEYVQELMKARSLPDLFEISTRHSQRQLARMTEQAQRFAGAAQKIAGESARPFGGGINTGA